MWNLQMLAHLHSLADEVVQILGEGGGKTLSLEDTSNGGSSDVLHGSNTVGIPKLDTDLGGGETLTGVLDNLVLDVSNRGLQPGGGVTAIGDSASAHALSGSMHATHAIIPKQSKRDHRSSSNHRMPGRKPQEEGQEQWRNRKRKV